VADRLEPGDVEGVGSPNRPITHAAAVERSYTRSDAPAGPPTWGDGLAPLPDWDAAV